MDEKIKMKDTRWDRIRKRHANSFTVKSEMVKKFIELELIPKRQMKYLNGDLPHEINPTLVMNLRHEMIVKGERKQEHDSPPIITKHILEKVKEHNAIVEDHLIKKKLTDFKASLKQKTKPKTILRPQLSVNLNNEILLKSLNNCQEHISDFYRAPQDAIQTIEKISKENLCKKKSSADKSLNGYLKKETERTHKEDSSINGIANSSNVSETPLSRNKSPSTTSATISKTVTRCVRFEESVKVISYSRESSFCSNSNTSEDVDSVISEFVDEVINEINEEAKLEVRNESTSDLIIFPVEQIEPTEANEDTFESEFKLPNQDEIHRQEGKCFFTKCEEKQLNCNSQGSFPFENELLKVTKISPLPKVEPVPEHVYSDSSERSSQDTESESNEQNAIIADLFRPKMPPKEILMRKYFLRWIHFVTIEKMDRENLACNKNDRIKKINSFLDSVRREKCRISHEGNKSEGNNHKSIVMVKKYRNKMKIQQDIIELQKLKLERQERVIMELKLSKLSEHLKQAKQELKAELKSVIRTGATKNRRKAQCLQIVANLRDADDEEFARLQGRSLMMPKFLARMQERALQRGIRHEKAKQRRLQLEAEKEATKIAAEEAKRLEDEEAKRQRIEALKEKRKQEKLRKIQKERERERWALNVKKSEEFCRKRLLRSVGINCFKCLIEIKRNNYRKAEKFRKDLLLRKAFVNWKKFCTDALEKRIQLADVLCKQIYKRTAFRKWRVYISDQNSKLMVAIDWYEFKFTERIFQHWVGLMQLARIVDDAKGKQALSHYQWHTKWKVIDCWRRLPDILRLEKETEERRQRWRLKIWELLPDYAPNREEELM